ncbi:MAG: hypothetical protein HKP27_08380 [Myxococcales bacterium]|nr:hypothetical protein [Myxococcales bacterium]
MKRVAWFTLLAIAVVLLVGVFWPAKIEVWVDDAGQPHLTNEDETPRAASRHIEPRQVMALWGGDPTGAPLLTPGGATSSEDDRTFRILRGAIDDLGRGETARAAVALEEVLARDPNRPEAHWYLALLDGQRGRLDSSEEHLRRFLATAGDDLSTWRASAERRLKQIEDERELLRPPEGALSLVGFESGHFRVQMDRALQDHAPDFADRVLQYLEDARGDIGSRLGVFPKESTGVVLYGKAAYMRAHAHRFSFQTVGFFDGRIHVVSAAHPAGELRTLLYHEYTHALFQERTGGHRPFWLNEGLAENAERSSRSLPALSRSERMLLRRQIEIGQWIPLSRLSQSFAGLDNDEARLAYLEATAAADWLERHTTSELRGYILDALGDGLSIDDALSSVLDVDTQGLEAAIQKEILDEFPTTRPAAREPEEEAPSEEETAKPAAPATPSEEKTSG